MYKGFALASCLIVLGLSVISPAQAKDAGDGYFLVSVGNADADFRPTVADAVQGDDTAFEIGVGLWLNEYLAIEASYQDFGEPDGFAGCPPDRFCIAIVPFAREPVDLKGWSAALRGEVPVSDSLALFGKVGLLAWDASAGHAGLDSSGTDFLYAAGISGDLNDRLSLQLSWERVELDIETVKLGMRFSF